MKLIINGEIKNFETVSSVLDIMTETKMLERKAAIAVNGSFVSKENYAETALKDDDTLEIITPMQGG